MDRNYADDNQYSKQRAAYAGNGHIGFYRVPFLVDVQPRLQGRAKRGAGKDNHEKSREPD